MRRLLVNTLLLLSLGAAALGCSSRAQVICELECACQHCSDHDEIRVCESHAAREEVADVYGCSDAWTAFTVCYEEKGTCDETSDLFSTREENNADRCGKEARGLLDCIEAASAHDGNWF
ncbi:hypothetical protein [Polyangium spumosum]|uniref:Uncharacterized protein n=1 Tax=Polyangium spumosum TaxID=889282 RepID=A0A6N7PJQ0_9BACT|nr:hypothetical protein [Polyangium spumosum]MRG90385.1 hypothetical protein [Polyangium spumosum]